jgi:hypothetical protein
MPGPRRTAALETVAAPGDVVCKLVEDLTREMLEEGQTGTAIVMNDNPRWGIDPGAFPYVASTTFIEVVPWDKKTPLDREVLYLARRIGAYWKVYAAEC